MLITHLGLTKDPPQKWFPFLHRRGQKSQWNVSSTVCLTCWWPVKTQPDTTKHQTHRSLRLTVHGELPGIPFTIRRIDLWKRSSLFPHSLNSTFSMGTKKVIFNCEKLNKHEKLLQIWLDINPETNPVVQSWTLSLQLFGNKRKETNY